MQMGIGIGSVKETRLRAARLALSASWNAWGKLGWGRPVCGDDQERVRGLYRGDLPLLTLLDLWFRVQDERRETRSSGSASDRPAIARQRSAPSF